MELTELRTETVTASAVSKDVEDAQATQPEQNEILFAGSTHQFLIYFDADNGAPALFIGVTVIVCQFVLMGVLQVEGQTLISRSQQYPLVIDESGCDSLLGTTSSILSGSVTDSLIECDVPEYSSYDGAIWAFVVCSAFLMQDTFMAIKALLTVGGTCSKVGAIAILVNVVYTAYVGCFFAVQGYFYGTRYDAITNCIGVLFVAEVDEKVFAALKHVTFGDKLKSCCCNCLCCPCCDSMLRCLCLLACAAIFIAGGIIVMETATD